MRRRVIFGLMTVSAIVSGCGNASLKGNLEYKLAYSEDHLLEW